MLSPNPAAGQRYRLVTVDILQFCNYTQQESLLCCSLLTVSKRRRASSTILFPEQNKSIQSDLAKGGGGGGTKPTQQWTHEHGGFYAYLATLCLSER